MRKLRNSTLSKYDLPERRIPVITFISPLCRLATSRFKCISRLISIFTIYLWLYDHFSAANLRKIIELWANSLKKITFPLAEDLCFKKAKLLFVHPISPNHDHEISLQKIGCFSLVFQKRLFCAVKEPLLPCKTYAFAMPNNRFWNAKV